MATFDASTYPNDLLITIDTQFTPITASGSLVIGDGREVKITDINSYQGSYSFSSVAINRGVLRVVNTSTSINDIAYFKIQTPNHAVIIYSGGKLITEGLLVQHGTLGNNNASQTFGGFTANFPIPCIWVETGNGTGIYERWLNANISGQEQDLLSHKAGEYGNVFLMDYNDTSIKVGNGINGNKVPLLARVLVPNIILGIANSVGGYAAKVALAPGGILNAKGTSFCAYLHATGSASNVSLEDSGFCRECDFRKVQEVSIINSGFSGYYLRQYTTHWGSVNNQFSNTCKISDCGRVVIDGFSVNASRGPYGAALKISCTDGENSSFNDIYAYNMDWPDERRTVYTPWVIGCSIDIGTGGSSDNITNVSTVGTFIATGESYVNGLKVASTGISHNPDATRPFAAVGLGAKSYKNVTFDTVYSDFGKTSDYSIFGANSGFAATHIESADLTGVTSSVSGLLFNERMSTAVPVSKLTIKTLTGSYNYDYAANIDSSVIKGIAANSVSTKATKCNDSHFIELHTSDSAGKLVINFAGIVNTTSVSVSPDNNTLSHSIEDEGLYIPTINEEVIFTWPHTLLGWSAFTNVDPERIGTDLGTGTSWGNFDVYYKFNGAAWTALTKANLMSETMPLAAVGFTFAIKIVCNTTDLTGNFWQQLAIPMSRDNTVSYPAAQETLTITVKDIISKAVLAGARVAIFDESDDSVLLNTTTDANGQVTVDVAQATVVYGWARKSSAAPYYAQGEFSGTVGSGGLNITVLMQRDE